MSMRNRREVMRETVIKVLTFLEIIPLKLFPRQWYRIIHWLGKV